MVIVVVMMLFVVFNVVDSLYSYRLTKRDGNKYYRFFDSKDLKTSSFFFMEKKNNNYVLSFESISFYQDMTTKHQGIRVFKTFFFEKSC